MANKKARSGARSRVSSRANSKEKVKVKGNTKKVSKAAAQKKSSVKKASGVLEHSHSRSFENVHIPKISLSKSESLKIFENMVKARCLEERLIKMYKQNDGFFWIGGPGEEAFNIPLGMLVQKGHGLDYDYLHFHYRSNGILVAMGMDPIDAMRQMKNTATDPFSRGRNFCSHISIEKWNVAPISSPIEIQYGIAPGTARAQKRHGGTGISIVNGGDAGTAEGDFATGLIWSTRPGEELPVLFIVTNNKWGISTSFDTQHGEKFIADRGKAFGMRTEVVDGNDVEASYAMLKDCMDYIRRERKPVLLEAFVSRLYGHSSASGANFNTLETDPIKKFERQLIAKGWLTEADAQALWDHHNEAMLAQAKQVREEPQPSAESIWDHVFHGQMGRKERYW